MPLSVWSSARYTFPLPDGHRFPVAKYALLREAVISEGIVAPERVLDPARAELSALELVHTPDYVRRFSEGALDAAEIRRLGFPWSEALVERSYRAVGGTIAAARHALEHGVAMNLAGGTHHAFPDHGEGFCVFNDVAVAIRLLRRDGLVRRAAVVDLDVHQGNGTHAIFAGDAEVFTFSMHGGRNYPFHKVAGTLDVELADGTGDDDYLRELQTSLPRVLADSAPDLVVYIAGADPHESDALGRLALTFDGLARRDALVLESCREVGIPVAITIGGGYGRRIDDTVAVHLRTVRIAAALAR
ncbi:MAG TPA: histone deacetylase [Gemmatimonadaceae bacterium]|jgi:acetoin utilization deacetylase AcuC-like enzyme|nr:histone deacetylase [Gemmatimonadaceae bacterium]